MRKCNSCTPNIDKTIDISGLDPSPYDDAAVLWALDACGNPIVVEPPESQISELDRKKLDSIIIDGDGNKYLSDDGKYKKIVTDNVSRIVLIYTPTNFITVNRVNIDKIIELLDGGYSPQVYIQFENYTLQVSVAYSENDDSYNTIQFLFDGMIIDLPTLSRAGVSRQKFRILISLDVSGINPVIVHFEVGGYVDNSDYIIINGNGDLFLANDGEYKEALTQEQIDEILANYYNKTDSDNRYYQKSEVYTKDESNDLFLTKDEFTDTIADYDTSSEVDTKIDEATKDAVMYDPSGSGLTWPVNLRGDIILKNDMNLFGTTLNGSVINIAEVSRFNTDTGLAIVDLGSTSAHINLNAYDRPTVQHADNTVNDIAYLEDVEALEADISGQILSINNQITTINGDIVTTNTRIDNLQDAFDTSITNINNELTDLDARVTTNTTNIATNRTDIDSILQLIEDRNHFQGYYQTNQEIFDLQNLIAGDYAWSAESNSVWSYNGTVWNDTGDAIPNEATPGSDLIPLVDSGTGNAGVLSEYARGDHRHPEDTTKANVTDLDNYLPLAGNTQLTGMTGDIWLAGNALRLTDSGNTYIKQDSATETTQIVSTGTGGVDIITNAGTVKANGQRIVVNGNNGDALTITANNQIGFNVGGASGGSLSVNATGVTAGGNLFAGQFVNNVSLQSSQGDIIFNPLTGKAYYGVNTIPGNEIAKISDVEAIAGEIPTVPTKLSELENDVPFAEVSQLPEKYQLPADESTVTRTSTDVQIESKKAELVNGEYVISNESIIVPSADATHAGAYPADHYNIVQGISSTYVSNDSLNNTLQDYDTSIVVDQKIADAVGAIPGVTIIDNLNSTDGTVALSANQGRILNEKFSNYDTSAEVDVKIQQAIEGIEGVTVIDNLNSTSATAALSANQGRVLNVAITDERDRAVLEEQRIENLIPTKVSDLPNDAGYITSAALPDLSDYVLKAGDSMTGELIAPSINADAIKIANIDKTGQINAIDISGDGTTFLSSDGTYKAVSGGSGDYIPLAGTVPSSPVTGNIVFDNGAGMTFNDTSYIMPVGDGLGYIGNTDNRIGSGAFNTLYANVIGTAVTPVLSLSINSISVNGVSRTAEIGALDISGNGTLFLSNDGTYKDVSASGEYIPLSGTDQLAGSIVPINNGIYTLGDTTHWLSNVFTNSVNSEIIRTTFILPYTEGASSLTIGSGGYPITRAYFGDNTSIYINNIDKTNEIKALTITGDGNSFLANDGTYKPIPSTFSSNGINYEERINQLEEKLSLLENKIKLI